MIVLFIRKAKPRMFNGVNITNHDHPWHCIITYKFYDTQQMVDNIIGWSGGVLISKKHVLTAAHSLKKGYEE